ncbi:unnamed protein product, partial [Rotaria magnacalcarata]
TDIVIKEISLFQMFSPPIADIIEIEMSNSLDDDVSLQVDPLAVK